jgi:hypothetical protein
MVSRRALILLAGLCADAVARGAAITVSPPSGAGRPGEALRLEGSGFGPSATLSIEVGGAPVVPAGLTADASGALAATIVLLAAPLPAGKHDVRAAGGALAVARNAYLVRPVVTLDPPIGDGRAGATWRTDKALPPGGYSGMVFTLNGTGLPADTFIPADSVRIGRTPCVHDPIRIGRDGVLPSTTIIVAAAMQSGRYDLVLAPAAGAAVTFAATYSVAPWAASETVRQRAAARALEEARVEILALVAVGGDVLPADDVADVTSDVTSAEIELKGGNFDNVEELVRQIREKLAALGKQVATTRRDKLRALADVIASGFDTIQPPDAPPARQGGASVAQGRRKLKEAAEAIAGGRFEEAKALLKASNELLKKARADAGVQATEEPVRW